MTAPILETTTQSATEPRLSKGRTWTGRIMSALPVLFLLFDGVMKLVKPEFVVKATIELGYPESVIVPLGFVLCACTVLYLIPRTAGLGAILLTGYLGGAVATQVRAGQGLFEISFPVVFGVLLWGGLWLQEAQLGRLVPLSRTRRRQPRPLPVTHPGL